jgi:hypothetical protein
LLLLFKVGHLSLRLLLEILENLENMGSGKRKGIGKRKQGGGA